LTACFCDASDFHSAGVETFRSKKESTRRLFRQQAQLTELLLSAIRGVERELRRLVVSEIGLPTILVRRQPNGAALSAPRGDGDALCTHRAAV
jgi:hypothetical protein